MSQITKRQHFVPQFYLRQFTDKTGKLHCYRKKEKKTFSAHPADICFKNYGYEIENPSGNTRFLLPNEIEKLFATLEGEYSQVLRSVVSKCLASSNGSILMCTDHEKEVLCSMVSNFLVRNLLAVDSYVDHEATQSLVETDQELRNIDDLLKSMNLGSAKAFLELAQMKLFLNPAEDGVARIIIDNLSKLNMSFLVSDSNRFVTSDCPVGHVIDNDRVVNTRLPLSPYVSVVYSSSEISKQFHGKVSYISSHWVNKLNYEYLSWDLPEMIIAQSPSDLLQQNL